MRKSQPRKTAEKEDSRPKNITDKGSEGRKGLVCSELEKAQVFGAGILGIEAVRPKAWDVAGRGHF